MRYSWRTAPRSKKANKCRNPLRNTEVWQKRPYRANPARTCQSRELGRSLFRQSQEGHTQNYPSSACGGLNRDHAWLIQRSTCLVPWPYWMSMFGLVSGHRTAAASATVRLSTRLQAPARVQRSVSLTLVLYQINFGTNTPPWYLMSELLSIFTRPKSCYFLSES